jgi:CRISPR-associated protein Csb2
MSTGFTTLGWTDVPRDARELIETLASVLPEYCLPDAVGTHSRHYMPMAVLDKGREKTTLVFDTWAQVDKGMLAVKWPVELPADQNRMLAELAARLNYLGRSESWVEVVAVEQDRDASMLSNCFPCSDSTPQGPGWEQVSMLAPVSPEVYLAWRAREVDAALASIPDVGPTQTRLTAKDRKLLKARQERLDVYPADLIACLLAGTGFLRDHGWSQPPGSHRVFYWRRADALEAGAPRPALEPHEPLSVETILLSLRSSTGNDHALPATSRALPQAELLHRALVSAADPGSCGACPVLTGCDTDGKPLRGHAHAHLLHLDLDGDGHLDHCLVWAPMGLDATAQCAVRRVRQSWTKGGKRPLRLAIAGVGDRKNLLQLPGSLGERMAQIIGPRDGARVWTSVTPFVAPRFCKRRGTNTLAGQVAAELRSRGFPPVEIEQLDPREPAGLRLRHSVRLRRKGPPPPMDHGFRLRLSFSEPVSGPIAIGYASHFGLGLFAAVFEQDV